jgi:hypothetical protein
MMNEHPWEQITPDTWRAEVPGRERFVEAKRVGRMWYTWDSRIPRLTFRGAVVEAMVKYTESIGHQDEDARLAWAATVPLPPEVRS